MNALLLSIALVFPLAAQEKDQPARGNDKRPMIKLDGDWMVTYAEKDGKKMEGKEFTQVMIKNNVVTCRHDGKEKSWRLEFGPHNMVRCTEEIDGKVALTTETEKREPGDKSKHTHHGVYIASPEYFCICLHKGHDRRTIGTTQRREDDGQRGTGARFGEHGAQGGNFVIILHRANGANSTSTTPK